MRAHLSLSTAWLRGVARVRSTLPACVTVCLQATGEESTSCDVAQLRQEIAALNAEEAELDAATAKLQEQLQVWPYTLWP